MQWIEKCLTSLYQSSAPTKIIVIDNASTDGTVTFVQQNFPEVELILSDKNLGFGRANNIGLRKALEENFDHIVLLNQDVYVDRNTIEEIINVQVENPEYGIISAMQYKNSGVMEPFFESLLESISPEEFDLRLIPLPFIHAAFWVISKNCLKKVGLFDPLFPHYGEDNDYCQRVLFFGFKMGILKKVKIVHDIGDRGIYPFNKYFRRLDLLMQLKNPKIDFRMVFSSAIISKLKLGTKHFFLGNFRRSFDYISDTLFLFSKKNKLKKNREISMKDGMF